MCLPTPELSTMFKPQKVQPVQAEVKTRPASPIDEKPIDIVDIAPVESDFEVLKRSAEQSFAPDELKVESQEVEAVKTIKEEIIDVEAKTDFCSEDSASLPGIVVDSYAPPVGFEPGMFKQDEESVKVKSEGQSKPKKKKKDKKKHKHKHKHKLW